MVDLRRMSRSKWAHCTAPARKASELLVGDLPAYSGIFARQCIATKTFSISRLTGAVISWSWRQKGLSRAELSVLSYTSVAARRSPARKETDASNIYKDQNSLLFSCLARSVAHRSDTSDVCMPREKVRYRMWNQYVHMRPTRRHASR